MTIDKHCAVIFDYTITDEHGQLLESSQEDGLSGYIHGTETALVKLENTLAGQQVGFHAVINFTADEAFGDRQEELVITVPRDDFEGEELTIGMEFDMNEDEDNPSLLPPWRIVDLTDKTVTLDANHPYAGLNLIFTVDIKEVREATEEEIETGILQTAGTT